MSVTGTSGSSRRLRRLLYPPWRDPLLATLMLGLSMIYLFSDVGDWLWTDLRDYPTSLWAQALALTVMSSLEALRGRWPGWTLASATVITLLCVFWLGTSLMLVIIMSDLLYAAVLYGTRRLSRTVIGIVVIAIPASAVVTYLLTADGRIALLLGLTLLLVPATTVTWAMQVRLHREVADQERARATQLERLVELERHAAVQGERSRMARDLHDVVAGQLSAIAIQSEALLAMKQRDPEAEASVLRSVRENSVQALAEMRAMIGLLRGDETETASTPRLDDLDTLVDSARAAGVALTVCRDAIPNVTRAVELAGYRIAQEALTNVVKHGSRGEAVLSVAVRDGGLLVEITNPLAGRIDEAQPGVGLETMTERAATVGGWVEMGVNGRDEQTWRISAWLPLDPNQNRERQETR